LTLLFGLFNYSPHDSEASGYIVDNGENYLYSLEDSNNLTVFVKIITINADLISIKSNGEFYAKPPIVSISENDELLYFPTINIDDVPLM